jgi:phage shock protein PspC (stress-responsive transcriptional regulator)
MNTTTASPEADTKSAINPEADPKSAINPEAGIPARPQPLCRPFQDRMLAGVAAGIARYLGVDVTVVRIVLAVLTVVGGVGVPIYLAGWLLIPEEGSEQSIASEFIQSLPARSR